MSGSLGMGTIIGPSVAIVIGGPGALFWLVFYALVGAITKFTEVTFGVYFREKTADGSILGGPTQYLKKLHPWLASWYAWATMFLFAGWSGLQANALAEMLWQVQVPHYITGIALAILVLIMLYGGLTRIGKFSTALFPVMFCLYVSVACYILWNNSHELGNAFRMMFDSIFSPAPALGGFAGATFYQALSSGTYKGAYTTESGMGTAAIPHSLANVQKASDQGILAMSAVFVDAFLCFLSGLMVLVTGVWTHGTVTNIMMYNIFKTNLPMLGESLLIFSISMFVLGTVIGNSFNGRQSFAAITRYRWLNWYYLFVCIVIILGSMCNVPLIWAIMDVILPFVAIPNLIGIIYLACKYPQALQNLVHRL